MMKSDVFEHLEQSGYQGRAVSVEHLSDLKDGIQKHHSEGSIDRTFFDECLTGFDFNLPERMPDARSLIVVAVKQPQIRFTFTSNARQIGLIVPPTYVRGPQTDTEVENMLAEILSRAGYRVERAVVPKKLLAVRSGLALYGKNNITYVPGLGSFHRLAAFYSDLPCETDAWQEPVMMERCETCAACLKGCPTGAITAERFLLRAERCIVFHNEHPNEVPFPAWLDPAWHNCLIGCMLCQRPCPENKDCLEWIEDSAAFSSDETRFLLGGRRLDDLPAQMVEKLNQSDLVYLLDVFPRNLSVLLERPEIA